MSKRFGRNQKRKLKNQIKILEENNNKLKQKLINTTTFPYLKTKSISIAVMPKIDMSNPIGLNDNINVVRVQIDPVVMMFEKNINIEDLEMYKNYPKYITDDFLIMIKKTLIDVIPKLLKNI